MRLCAAAGAGAVRVCASAAADDHADAAATRVADATATATATATTAAAATSGTAAAMSAADIVTDANNACGCATPAAATADAAATFTAIDATAFLRFRYCYCCHCCCSRYLGLFVLQLLPSLLIGFKYASFVYFGLLAVSTVYLGAKRQDIPDVSAHLASQQIAIMYY